jgi:hypothetical protein
MKIWGSIELCLHKFMLKRGSLCTCAYHFHRATHPQPFIFETEWIFYQGHDGSGYPDTWDVAHNLKPCRDIYSSAAPEDSANR